MKIIDIFSYEKIIENGCEIDDVGVITKGGKYLGETFYTSRLTSRDFILDTQMDFDKYFNEAENYYEHHYHPEDETQQHGYVKLMKEAEGIVFSISES